jgi:hypothetical protein
VINVKSGKEGKERKVKRVREGDIRKGSIGDAIERKVRV